MKLAICLLLAALMLLGQQHPAPPAADSCFIDGRVINAANAQPVRKARLTLRRTDNPTGGSGIPASYNTASDDQGRFAMKDIEPGKYQFSAERPGFSEIQYGARRPGRTGATLSLDSGQRLSGIVFRLTPHAVIAGRILDEDGEPVEQAFVRPMRYQYIRGKKQLTPAGWSSTDDLGEYRIFGLAPGRYYLEATHRQYMFQMGLAARSGQAQEEAFVPTYYPGATDITTATMIELRPGSQLRGMDFTLSKARTVRVSGRVAHLPESAPQLVVISLVPRGQSNWDWVSVRRARVLDSQGKFEMTGVRPGSYFINAMTRGGKETYSTRQSIDVGSTNLENLVLTLSPGPTLSGQLRFEGQPPPNLTELQVSLQTPNEGEMRFQGIPSGQVKEDAAFTLANVGIDVYKAEVSGLPDGYYLKSVRIGDDELKETGIDTSRGEVGPLTITVSSRAGQIEGTVLNAKQQPTAGVTVVLVPELKLRDRSEAFKDVTTDQYGRFLLKTVEPGQYKLFAFEDVESGEYTDPDFLKPVEDRGHAIVIREGSRESAELKLIPAAPPAPKPKK